MPIPEGFALDDKKDAAAIKVPEGFTVDAEGGMSAQPETSALRRAGDIGVSTMKGIIGFPEAVVGLADMVTGGRVGKAAESVGYRPAEARAILDTLYSPAQQEANAKVHEAKGFVPTIEAALENPSTIGHAAIESAPAMIGGAGMARGVLKVAPKVAPLIAAAIGEGAMTAGSTAEQTRQQSPDGRLTAKQSAIAAGSGALTGVLGIAGGKVAQRLGITDIDTFLASGAPVAAKKNALKAIFEGVISEGALEELPQSAQEQAAQNIALGRPAGEGVAEAAASGMLVGGLMGGGGNAIAQVGNRGMAPAPVAPAEPSGPLSRAVSRSAAPPASIGSLVAERRGMAGPAQNSAPVAGQTPSAPVPETETAPVVEAAPAVSNFTLQGGIVPEVVAPEPAAETVQLPPPVIDTTASDVVTRSKPAPSPIGEMVGKSRNRVPTVPANSGLSPVQGVASEKDDEGNAAGEGYADEKGIQGDAVQTGLQADVQHADAEDEASVTTSPAGEKVSRIRAMQLRNQGEEATDIKGGLTGWKVVQHPQGAVLVHRTEDRIIPFNTDSNKYADVLRAKADAQVYAIENPITIASSGPIETETKPLKGLEPRQLSSLEKNANRTPAMEKRYQELKGRQEAQAPVEVAPEAQAPAVAPEPDWRQQRAEAEANADAVVATARPITKGKTPPRHILMNIVNMRGEEVAKLSAPYDGTKEDALRVAKGLKFHAAEEYNASMQQSQVFGTDEKGAPKYAMTQGAGETELHEVAKQEAPAVPPPSPKAAATEQGKGEPQVEAPAPVQPVASVDDTATRRAILTRLSSPKRLKDRLVQSLAADHGKEIVNALVKEGMVRFPGQGRAEITKVGAAWLEQNPPPPKVKAKRTAPKKVEAAPVVAPVPVAVAPAVPDTPAEVVKEAVKTAKQEGTPLKEQKKYLVANLDDAIKDAPNAADDKIGLLRGKLNELRTFLTAADTQKANSASKLRLWQDPEVFKDSTLEKRQQMVGTLQNAVDEADADKKRISADIKAAQQALRDADAYVTIDVPDDGTFEVYNTKAALKAFKAQVEKLFPAAETKGGKQGYGNPPKPTGAKAEGLQDAFHMPTTEGLWHSNGHVMIKGKEQVPFKSKSDRFQDNGPKQNQDALNRVKPKPTAGKPVVDAVFVAFGKGDGTGKLDNGRYEATSTEPLKLGKDENGYVRLYDADGNTADLDQKYYVYAKQHYPDAKIRINGADNAVTFVDGKEVVAIVMPMRKSRNGDALDTAIAARQPAFDLTDDSNGTLSPSAISRIESLISKALPLGAVTVDVVDSITPPPGSEQAFAAHGVKTGKVAGMTQVEKNLTSGEVRSIITLALDGATEETGTHEIFHVSENLGIITPKDLSILERAYPSRDGVASSERRADAFADYVAGRGKKPVLSAKLVFDKIRKFLDRLASVLKGQGWRTADDVFADLMEGRLKRNAKGEIDPPAGVQFMTAWHGSPHKFDKFSTSAIGTGEGAQAYGAGLYFAEAREVAEWYRDKLSRGATAPSLDLIERYFEPGRIVNGYDGLDKVLDFKRMDNGWQWMVKVISVDAEGNPRRGERPRGHSTTPTWKDIEQVLGEKEPKGALYQVELAPSEDQYLLWDKPLSEQSEKVKSAIFADLDQSIAMTEGALSTASDRRRPTTEESLRKLNSRKSVMTTQSGRDFYKSLANEQGSDKAASEYLHSLGVRGIKYLDGSSRGKGDGNYNYVIFNENDVEITAQFSLATAIKNRDPQALRSSLTLHPKVQGIAATIMNEGANVSRWQKTVGTMYHLAEKLEKEGKPQFKAVFNKGQEFLNDVSALAAAAESLAPDIFPKLGTGKGLFHYLSKKDSQAIAAPLYEGTLYGGADPIKGKVFSDAELKTIFKLSPHQIDLYRQARAAVDRSLDDMARSLIAKNAKMVKLPYDRDMELKDMAEEIGSAIQERIDDMQAELDQYEADHEARIKELSGKELKEAQKERDKFVKPQQAAIDRHKSAIENVKEIARKTTLLKSRGYFPLMRFGDKTVTVKDKDGKTLFFGMYESTYKAKQAQLDLVQQYPDATVTMTPMGREKFKLYGGLNLEALQLFAEHLDAEEAAPYQEYLKVGMNNRSAMKRLIHRKGTEGYSEDAVRTLAQFIVSNARHASTQYNLHDMRQLAAAIPEQEQGDVQDQAVKLYEYLSKPTEEASKLRGYLFMHYLGGSLASGIVNMTQPIMMTAPYLATKTTPAKVAKFMIAASKMSFTDPAKVQGALGIALRRAEADGITAPQEIYQLTAMASNKLLASNPVWNAALKGWGGFFATAEAFNRRTTFISAFNIAKDNGKADSNAYREAVDAVTATQGVYNKGNRPNWARGIVGATAFTFKQYSVMYLELYNRLPVKQRLIMMGLLWLMAGLQGMPFAEDAEDVIDTLGQWAGYSTNSRQWLERNAKEIPGGNFMLRGVSSVLPIDLQGRMGLHNLIPGTALLKQSEIDKGRDVAEFFGPAGGLVKALGDSLSLAATGLYGRATIAALPRAAQNIVQGVEMMTTGAGRDKYGRKTVEVNKAEAAVKMTGFNPERIAEESRVKGSNMQDMNMVRVRKNEIVNQWAYGIVNKDRAEIQEAVKKLKEWNAKNPDWRITNAFSAAQKKAQAMRATSKERFIKSVPKEMRRRMIDELG